MQYPADSAGNLGEVVTSAYHPQLSLNSLFGSATYVPGTSYDAAGRIVQLTRGVGALTSNYEYYGWAEKAIVDGMSTGQGGRLKKMTTGSLQDMRYTYEATGNVRKIEDYKAVPGTIQVQDFTYDAMDRLRSAHITGGTLGLDGSFYEREYYNYDAKGRLTGLPWMGTYGYSSTHTHAVEKLNGVQKYWYDANGNMTTRIVDANTFNLAYDAENRLVSVSGALGASFVYNANGRRVKSTVAGVTTAFIGDYYEWRGSAAASVKYYYAGGVRVAMRTGGGAPKYLLGDHLGSTSVLVNGDGTGGQAQGYMPWGETRYGGVETEYQFTGQYRLAALGLDYYGQGGTTPRWGGGCRRIAWCRWRARGRWRGTGMRRSTIYSNYLGGNVMQPSTYNSFLLTASGWFIPEAYISLTI